ncbi:hypothetical protein M2137_001478 [Parabacteroides sp. PFB2-10]|uniref:leucine-rich repeat domain-containing protein n=1 Tax=Parabacteroides sp. PFB2-10 TaxID=1742405 RepID=UPI0024742C89|nr:leucine-rich repeat domain-containing protein [Parabacteroides sp. PFB2-10]MDH6312703.1 hypothetical protein [Parabacteroides sp. PFB2-10]
MKKMKTFGLKGVAILIAISLCVQFTSCGESGGEPDPIPPTQTTPIAHLSFEMKEAGTFKQLLEAKLKTITANKEVFHRIDTLTLSGKMNILDFDANEIEAIASSFSPHVEMRLICIDLTNVQIVESSCNAANQLAYLGKDSNYRFIFSSYEYKLPKSLIEIGSGLFNNRWFGKLVIPSLVKIGNNAFERSQGGIGDIILPENLEEIGDCAFQYVEMSGKITIQGKPKIGKSAFQGIKCDLITISASEIGERAFASSRKVVFNSTPIERIGNYAFEKLNIDTLTLDCKYIGNGAFINASIKELNLLNTIEIGDAAFHNNKFTTIENLPESLKKIGGLAFGSSNCNIKSVVIPENLKEIGDAAFYLKPGSGTLGSSVVMKSSTPPVGKKPWIGYPTIYVPKGSKSAYEKYYDKSLYFQIIEE